MTYDDYALVNCADCDKELVGENCAAKLLAMSKDGKLPADCPPKVGGRMFGRPFCEDCKNLRLPSEAAKE